MLIVAPAFRPNVGSGKFSIPCSRMQRALASAAFLNSLLLLLGELVRLELRLVLVTRMVGS